MIPRARTAMLIADAVLAAVWIASALLNLAAWRHGWRITVGRGVLGVLHYDSPTVMTSRRELSLDPAGPDDRGLVLWLPNRGGTPRSLWLVEWESLNGFGIRSRGARVLLWPPAALLLAAGLILRRRAARRGACPCGYPRTGLTPDAPCPECGANPKVLGTGLGSRENRPSHLGR